MLQSTVHHVKLSVTFSVHTDQFRALFSVHRAHPTQLHVMVHHYQLRVILQSTPPSSMLFYNPPWSTPCYFTVLLGQFHAMFQSILVNFLSVLVNSVLCFSSPCWISAHVSVHSGELHLMFQSTLVNSMFLTDIYSSSFNSTRPTRWELFITKMIPCLYGSS